MFRFDHFIEDWAIRYKAMQHLPGPNSKNQRFFLTDSFYGLSEFMRNIKYSQSPCVIMESDQEGRIHGGIDHPHYTLYFMVKAERMNNGLAALDAKLEAKVHMQKFLSYLRNQQDKGDVPGIEHIDIDDYLDYQSIGPLYDGWYGVSVTLEDCQQMSMCATENDYLF